MPTSYKIFISVLIIYVLTFIQGILYAHFDIHEKYTIILGYFFMIAFSFSLVGVYAGRKYIKTDNLKTNRLNKIGLIGNALLYILMALFLATLILVKLI